MQQHFRDAGGASRSHGGAQRVRDVTPDGASQLGAKQAPEVAS